VRHINHPHPRLRGKLTQNERYHYQASGGTLWSRVEGTRMQVRGQAMGNQPATGAF